MTEHSEKEVVLKTLDSYLLHLRHQTVSPALVNPKIVANFLSMIKLAMEIKEKKAKEDQG
mgnify:CR=1